MFSDDFIETTVIGLTQGTTLHGIKLLILRAKGSDDCMPLLIRNDEFEAIAALLSKRKKPTFDLVGKLTQAFNIRLEYLEIQRIPQGEHRSYAFYSSEDQVRRLEISLPTAVGLSMKHEIPIRIQRDVFFKSAQETAEEGRMAFALSEMTKELLEEAQRAAAEEDNYELAKMLRDELRRRSLPED